MSKKAAVSNSGQPIYRQIMEVLIGGILEGSYPEGELLPSVRQVSLDFGVSTLTAAKVFQELARDNITEKRRGIGFEVRRGVRRILLHQARRKFLEEEWPELCVRMRRLGFDARELLREARL